MDIKFKNGNYQFLLRSSAIIFNKDKTKILLFKGENREFYMLPGGKVMQNETSEDAIIREIKEEIGFNNIKFKLSAIGEEFIVDRGYNNQQIEFIYNGIYNDVIKEIKFKGLESNWLNFEWIDINNINSYNIQPTYIKNIIMEPQKLHHFIDNERKNI